MHSTADIDIPQAGIRTPDLFVGEGHRGIFLIENAMAFCQI